MDFVADLLPVTKKKKYLTLDDLKISAIYFLIKNGVVIYIGMSRNVIQRLNIHKSNIDYDYFRIIECDKKKLIEYEYRLIKIFKPINNSDGLFKYIYERNDVGVLVPIKVKNDFHRLVKKKYKYDKRNYYQIIGKIKAKERYSKFNSKKICKNCLISKKLIEFDILRKVLKNNKYSNVCKTCDVQLKEKTAEMESPLSVNSCA